jgi:hypothetical protein
MKQGICKICKKEFSIRPDSFGIYCGRICRYKDHSNIVKKGWLNRENKVAWNKGKTTPNGENANHWLGDGVGYWGIHTWLQKNYGWANKCEDKNCTHKSKTFEWAKLKDKPYQRRREYFIQLCKSYHNKYDEILLKGWKTRKVNQKII